MNEEQIQDSMEEQVTAREAKRQELQRKFNPDRMKVIRKELFANLRDPAVTIRDGNITFNTACISGLEDVVWINLMIDETEGLLAVQRCKENDKHALRWCIAKQDKRKTRKMTCPGFTDLLYQRMKWDKKCRYKILGYQIDFDGEPVYVFDLTAFKIYRERVKVTEEQDGEEVVVEMTPADRKGYFPDDIANTFGVPMEQHKKEMEVTDIDGFVSFGILTSPTREKVQNTEE